jgi:hypothetical protein
MSNYYGLPTGILESKHLRVFAQELDDGHQVTAVARRPEMITGLQTAVSPRLCQAAGSFDLGE